MAILKNTIIDDIGYLSLPVGTEAQRLATVAGTLVYFTSLGGTSWTVPANVDSIEILVVGGGGGGGSDMGGGGGAGGVVYDGNYPTVPGQAISLSIGGGGVGASAGIGQAKGSNGGNTTFGTITAYGGGGGASAHDRSTSPAGDGASGGGAAGGAVPPSGGANGTIGDNGLIGNGGYGGGARGRSIHPDQGHDGSWGSGYWYPGGGGGASEPGTSYPRPHGGRGAEIKITGETIFFGGGGGGSGYSNTGGDGGLGGGGGGAVNTTFGGVGYNNGANGGGGGTSSWANTPGGNAGANSGGGGGGGAHYNSNNFGGNGGSGIVIIKYNTTNPTEETSQGALRINSSTGEAEFFSSDATWQSLSIPFKERTHITTNYMLGGYKSSSAWNNVNRTSMSTDTTVNLGDNSLERSFNYQSGACSKNVAWVFGAGNGHAVQSNYVIGFNMRTDQQYTGAFARNLSGDKLRDGTVWKEHYMAWTSGSAELDRFNMLTETQSIVGIGAPAGSTADAWGMSWENEGMFTRNNDGTLFDFATETYGTWVGTFPSVHHQQKSMNSKLNFCWAGNEGSYAGGTQFRRTNWITRSTSGTYAKPISGGEENFTMGQDHAYQLGCFNGAQNNESFRWNYYTESGFTGGVSMQPKGKAGSSSGLGAWRDN